MAALLARSDPVPHPLTEKHPPPPHVFNSFEEIEQYLHPRFVLYRSKAASFHKETDLFETEQTFKGVQMEHVPVGTSVRNASTALTLEQSALGPLSGVQEQGTQRPQRLPSGGAAAQPGAATLRCRPLAAVAVKRLVVRKKC